MSQSVLIPADCVDHKLIQVVALDIETTGLPKMVSNKQYAPIHELGFYESSRVLSVAFVSIDRERSFMVKPNGFLVKGTHIHGISQQDADTKGIEWEAALDGDLIEWLRGKQIVVAHNAKFDMNVLKSELFRQGTRQCLELLSILQTKQVLCTMELAGKIPWPTKFSKSLSIVYSTLLGKEMTNHHDALDDAKHCLEIFSWMAWRFPSIVWYE